MARSNVMLMGNDRQPLPTIAEHIADQLRADIVSAEIEPGSPIRQSHIAARFGVSQAPVREALGQLASEELVEYQSNRGVRVTALRKDIATEIAALRILVESNLVRHAAGNFTADDESRADLAIKATAQARTIAEKLSADNRFHTAVYLPSNQPVTLEIVERLRARYVQYLGYMWKHTDHASASLSDHCELLKLLVNGEGEAAAAFLGHHINASTRAILASLPDE